MNEKVGEFQEFNRPNRESFHYYEWKTVYKSQDKAQLWAELNRLNDEAERGSESSRSRLAALFSEIDRRREFPRFRNLLQGARSVTVAFLVEVLNKFN